MRKPRVAILSPAAPDSDDDGRTARRWAGLLGTRYRVRVLPAWNGEPADCLVALHARRAAPSITAWKAANAAAPLVLMLSGTDPSRDIGRDAGMQAVLECADRLIVPHDPGAMRLPARLAARTRMVLPSARARRSPPKTRRHLRALLVGHLRGEESPETFFKVARLLAETGDILLDHIGAPLDSRLAAMATETAADCPGYRWLGTLPQEAALKRMQRAHVLVHAGRTDGGTRMVIESIRVGTPVLVARGDGNPGLPGRDYAGQFRWGNATQLAAMLVQCRRSMSRGAGLLQRVAEQCHALAPRFAPEAEAAALAAVIAELLPG